MPWKKPPPRKRPNEVKNVYIELIIHYKLLHATNWVAQVLKAMMVARSNLSSKIQNHLHSIFSFQPVFLSDPLRFKLNHFFLAALSFPSLPSSPGLSGSPKTLLVLPLLKILTVLDTVNEACMLSRCFSNSSTWMEQQQLYSRVMSGKIEYKHRKTLQNRPLRFWNIQIAFLGYICLFLKACQSLQNNTRISWMYNWNNHIRYN